MPSTKILNLFLYFMAIAHIISGISIPLLVFSGAFDSYADYFHQSVTSLAGASIRSEKALIALFGPTIASWGFLFLILVHHGVDKLSRFAYACLVAALLSWAIYDSLISYWFSLHMHLAINALAFAALLIPITLLRFRHSALC